MNDDHLGQLMQVLDIVRAADRGFAKSTRAALLDADDGTTPFDMLVAGRFDDARRRLGPGRARRVPTLAELSDEAKAARMPLPPEELIDARHDPAHRELRGARAARVVRIARNGGD